VCVCVCVFVCVALVTQNSMRMRRIILSSVAYRLYHIVTSISQKARFSKKKKRIIMSNFMKIRPMGAEFFHADRRTIMTKVMVDFLNFAKAPNIMNSWTLDRYSVHAIVLRDHQRIIKKLLWIFDNFCGQQCTLCHAASGLYSTSS